MTILTEATQIAAAAWDAADDDAAALMAGWRADNADLVARWDAEDAQRERTGACRPCEGKGVKELYLSGRLNDFTAVACPYCRG